MTSKVQVTAHHAIHCADPTAVATLESPFRLGPIDALVIPFVPIKNVFVYQKPASTAKDSFIPIERLRSAVTYLLDYYPHLIGRLGFNLGTGAAEVDRLDDVASLDRSGRILLTNLPDDGNALTPFDSSIEGVCRDPILAIQHTRFACGGVALGIRLHHIVCDAGGFFQLVRDMAALYRGLATSERPTLTEPPVIHSYLKDISVLSSEKVQKAREYKLTAFYLAVETETNAASDAEQPPQPPKPPVLGRTVRFSGDNLQALKQLASDPTGAGWVSTFEALSAFLCQWNYRIRLQHFMSQGTSEKEAAGKIVRGFWASINMRGPTRLNLSPRYLPNAVYPPYASFPHELLANEPLWKVAEALHGLIRGFDTHKIKMSTRWIAAQPNKSRIRVDFSFFDGNFTVSQWAAFSMYVGVDFDADEDGKPVPPALVGQPYTEISRVDGLGMFQSTEEEFYRTMENGGDAKKPCAFDVKLTFSEPLWEILDQEEEFWRYCS